MALADYILCDKCDAKLIYDADNRVTDELEYRLTGRRHPAVDALDVLCQNCSGVGAFSSRPSRRDAMSRQYKRPKDVPTSVLVQRLRELAGAVARHDMGEFTMRVPVELDRDADMVLDEAANRLERRDDGG